MHSWWLLASRFIPLPRGSDRREETVDASEEVYPAPAGSDKQSIFDGRQELVLSPLLRSDTTDRILLTIKYVLSRSRGSDG